MITTGTPVTIALFEWLTWFASQHPEWFDQSTDTHHKINQVLDSKATIDTDDVKSFFTFLCGFLLLFDGGLFSSNLMSVSEKNKGVSLRWSSNMSHEVSYSGWDRSTRMALDYICKRTIGYGSLTEDVAPVLTIMYSYLKRHQQLLMEQVTTLPNIHSINTKSTGLTKDLFVVLSSFPIALLDSFYVNFSSSIPNDFYLESVAHQLSAREFFSRPQSDSILVLDKVKMQYNLHFHSETELSFLADFEKQTLEFIDQSLGDVSILATVQSELDSVLNDQFKPRLSLLTLVLDHFNWPK